MIKHLKNDWKLSRILEGGDGERDASSAPPGAAEEAGRLAALRDELGKLGREKPPADLNAAIMKRVHDSEPRHWIYTFLFKPRHVLLRTSVASAATAAALVLLVGGIMVHFLVPGAGNDLEEPKTAPAAMAPADSDNPEALCPAGSGGEPVPEEAMRNVRFSVNLPHARDVRLIGDFNAWSEKGIVLDGPQDDGSWSVDIDLEPGKYQYMFVVDESEWVADENADAWVDDGYGHVNSVRYIM